MGAIMPFLRPKIVFAVERISLEGMKGISFVRNLLPIVPFSGPKATG